MMLRALSPPSAETDGVTLMPRPTCLMCWKSKHVRAAWFAAAVPRPAPPAGLGAARQQTGAVTGGVTCPQHWPREWQGRWGPPPKWLFLTRHRSGPTETRSNSPLLLSFSPSPVVGGVLGQCPSPLCQGGSGSGAEGLETGVSPEILCPAARLDSATGSQPETSPFSSSFSSSIPPGGSAEGLGSGGDVLCARGGSQQTQPSETSNSEPQNIRFPQPQAAFAKICVQGRAAALLRHRKNPKVGARGGTCALAQTPTGPGGSGVRQGMHPSPLAVLVPQCRCPWGAAPCTPMERS